MVTFIERYQNRENLRGRDRNFSQDIALLMKTNESGSFL